MPESLAIALYLVVTFGGAAALASLGWLAGKHLGLARFRWWAASLLLVFALVAGVVVMHAAGPISDCTECAGDRRRSLGVPLMVGWGMALFVTIGVFLAPRPPALRRTNAPR